MVLVLGVTHLGWGLCIVLVLGVMGVPTAQYIYETSKTKASHDSTKYTLHT